jgi:putative tryptophan/tyrosine transport system substrate-binding protein
MMERRTFVGSVIAATLFSALSLATIEWAWAQQPNRVPVVGLLMSSVSPHDPVLEALRAGLREQGYVEGRNIRLEYRGAQGNLDQLPRLAEELVRLKVDAIVVGNERTARVAKEASASIPIIVSLYNYDPVAGGLIDSFARPGGNLTGIFTRTSELVGKRLEQLKEMVPNLSRLAVFWDPLGQGELDELQLAARSIGIQLQLMELRPPYDFDSAFRTAKQNKADAVMVIATPAFYVERVQLGTLALKHGLATSSSFRDCTQAGGLISYGIEFPDAYYRLAYFIGRLLKGAKPSDLPFEQVTKFKMVVNLNTAKSLGLTTPQSILLRADEVFQ